jgi:hypothetical protein
MSDSDREIWQWFTGALLVCIICYLLGRYYL